MRKLGVMDQIRYLSSNATNTSQTAVALTGLALPVASTGAYRLDAWVQWTASDQANNGIRWAVQSSSPTASAMNWGVMCAGDVFDNNESFDEVTAYGFAGAGTAFTLTPAAKVCLALLKGTFVFTATGTLTMGFAKVGVSTCTCTVRAGSYAQLRKVG